MKERCGGTDDVNVDGPALAKKTTNISLLGVYNDDHTLLNSEMASCLLNVSSSQIRCL